MLGDDIGVFLAVARSIGRRGIEVHVAPTDHQAPGLCSRYVDEIHSLPPYHLDAAAWVGKLSELIECHGFHRVIPCDDAGLARLQRHAAALRREKLALPNEEALEIFIDKVRTRTLAERVGVPVARAASIAKASDAAALIDRLGLPLVLKPRRSHRPGSSWLKETVRIIRDRAELVSALAAVKPAQWLAESYFDGVGIGLSVFAEQGQIRLAWQHRRFRARLGGMSTHRTGTPIDPRLFSDVKVLADATRLDGVAMFEFRMDPATGAYVLIEVNPRLWGSMPLALRAGIDFPAALCGWLPASCVAANKKWQAATNLSAELDRLSEEWAMARSGREYLRLIGEFARFGLSVAMPSRFDSWAKDDPAPFYIERRQVLARLAGRLIGSRAASRDDRPFPRAADVADAV
ncbi:MAG: carboxylate--amine ligase [Sphingosinicella sp.]